MPDRRTHRGPHPEDARLFAPPLWPVLRQATDDLCWLLSRGYARDSSLKLVGDRYGLVARQRIAVARCACSEDEAQRRRRHQVGAEALAQQTLLLDGYNVLTTIEAAMAGGVILVGHDNTYRDMASMHGSYHKVAETLPALALLGRQIAAMGVIACIWYLDRPVSNSGRLKGVIEQIAAAQNWPWRVELVADPDAILADLSPQAENAGNQPNESPTAEAPRPGIVATADSVVLDHCRAWFNLAAETVIRHLPSANLVDLRREQNGGAGTGNRLR